MVLLALVLGRALVVAKRWRVRTGTSGSQRDRLGVPAERELMVLRVSANRLYRRIREE